LLACKDPGVIGEINACVPSCEDGMLCDTSASRCVACLSSDDCQDDERCASNSCVRREPIRDPMPNEGEDDDEERPGDDDSSGEGGEGSADDGEEHPPEGDDGNAGEGDDGNAGEGDEGSAGEGDEPADP
jgi:hypothetical protein